MDKHEFKKKLAEMLGEEKVKTVPKLEPGMVMVCTLAKHFDPKFNEFWDLWANKCEPRDDVRCCGCCEALAVSNWAYGEYTAMTEKARPYCIECAAELMKKEAEEEKNTDEPPPVDAES